MHIELWGKYLYRVSSVSAPCWRVGKTRSILNRKPGRSLMVFRLSRVGRGRVPMPVNVRNYSGLAAVLKYQLPARTVSGPADPFCPLPAITLAGA